MILSCQNICKTFVEKPVLQNISFHLNENDRLAIIGYNGAGKSTLLKIIVGELSADEGEVLTKKDASIGYLAQHQDYDFHRSIFDELLSVKKEIIELDKQMRTYEKEMEHLDGDALEQKMQQYTNATHKFEQMNGFAYKSEITGILKGLGFSEEDFQKQVRTLSGGQMTRVALGKLLLKNPDVLLLDEPTNHLDVSSIQWLESYLSRYKGAVIIVSHDRFFLDKVVNKVLWKSNLQNLCCLMEIIPNSFKNGIRSKQFEKRIREPAARDQAAKRSHPKTSPVQPGKIYPTRGKP